MKEMTRRSHFICVRSPVAFLKSIGFATVFLSSSLLGAESKSTRSAVTPEEYYAFAGADLFAEYGGISRRVVGVKGASLDLRVEAGIEAVPSWKASDVQAERRLKLSTFKAHIDLQRVESMHVALARANAELIYAASSAISDEERALQELMADVQIARMALGSVRPEVAERIAEQSVRLDDTRELIDEYVLKETERPVSSGTISIATLPFDYSYDSTADGLEFRCALSSPRRLDKAYLVVTVHYIDPKARNTVQTRTRLQSVKRVTAKPRKVKLIIRDLPLGFLPVACYFHLYGRDQEVATNLSQTQEAMTEEEVYRFFLGEYLYRNRNRTTAPEPLLLVPAEALRLQVSPMGLEQMVFIQVDKLGKVVSLSVDESKVPDLPAQMRSVLSHVRFFPGLASGEPVDSRLSLKITDLLR